MTWSEEYQDLSPGCLCFKRDLHRAYRQIFVDWKDMPLLGYKFNDKIYFDTALPMGLRSSARCCQRVTDALVFLFAERGYFAVNYLDDFGGADTVKNAWDAFTALGELLRAVGIQKAVDKATVPSTTMVFLGIQVDTVKMSLKIPEEKMGEILSELQDWQSKKVCYFERSPTTSRQIEFCC